MGHGDTSGARQNHNELLDFFIKNKKLRKKVISIILVVHEREVLAHYFYKGFAYSNHDIGSNYSREIINKIKKSRLPYSVHSGSVFNNEKVEFYFNKSKKIILYQAIKKDLEKSSELFKQLK